MPFLEGNDQSEKALTKDPKFNKILEALTVCPVAGCALIDGKSVPLYKKCVNEHGVFWFINAGPRWWVLEFDMDVDFERKLMGE